MPATEWDYSLNKYAKYCYKCKATFAGDENYDVAIRKLSAYFAQDRATIDGLYGRCRACVSAHQRNRRDGRICDSDALLAKQEGKCGICKKAITFDRNGPKVTAYVDHCHKSNQVRGILCVRCNTQLSQIENSEWLEKALNYLEKYKCE